VLWFAWAAGPSTAVPSGGVFRMACDFPDEFFDSLTLIVGQDKDPLPLVRCADFSR
jgi:hypothetical protein